MFEVLLAAAAISAVDAERTFWATATSSSDRFAALFAAAATCVEWVLTLVDAPSEVTL